MKRFSADNLLVIGIILAMLLCAIPFKQVVEVTEAAEYTSTDDYQIEVGFGGPSVTWVTVLCNRTSEIRFLYQTGVWISTQTVLLTTYTSMTASFNFNSEHSNNIVEIISDGPVLVRIIYTYMVEAEISIFSRVLYSISNQK